MKPNKEQKQWLREYLYQTMQYRETFEEVYDHVLLALEDEPKKEFFETNVLNILERDFGGMNGLLQLEENCRQSVDEMATVQFKDNFKRWFASPLIAFTAILFIAMIYLQLSPIKTGVALALLFGALLIVPVVLCSVRATRLGYTYADTKASIKDEIFRRLAYKSNRILFTLTWYSTVINQFVNYMFKPNSYLAMVAALLLIFLLVWPHIRQYKIKQKYTGDFNKLPIIPFKEDLFYGWFALTTMAIDLILKFTTAPNQTPQNSLSITAQVIGHSIITAILILMMINVSATIKLYRSEFKTTMVAS